MHLARKRIDTMELLAAVRLAIAALHTARDVKIDREQANRLREIERLLDRDGVQVEASYLAH